MNLLILVLAVVSLTQEAVSSGQEKENSRTSKGLYSSSQFVDNKNLFSPRMEYDEWTPLGRGDPLKNDPTYDYVPPVLERVHYWMEPSKRTPDPPIFNSGVLILGSSRTEPNFPVRATTPKYQVIPIKEPQADSRLDTMTLLDPFLKLMDVSKFGINLNPSTNNYYKPPANQNRIHPVNYQRPMHQQFNNRYPQQQHQQQQQQQQPQALQRPPYTMLMPPPPPPPPPPPSSTSVMTFGTIVTTTETPKTQSLLVAAGSQTTTMGITTVSTTTPTTKSNTDSNVTTIYPTTVLANTENLYKAVAIDMPEENETIKNDTENAEHRKTKLEEVIPIAAAINEEKEKDKDFGVVGQTSDHPAQLQKRPPQEQFHKPKDPSKYRPMYDISEPSGNNLKQPHIPMTQTMKSEEKFYSKNKWGADNRATTARPSTTTRVTNILTTDPMFKHYKQPSEPIKGPFYLIIQGHSKVKTYGASKNPINGLLTSNEIREDVEERKDRYGELYDLTSQETKSRKRGKSLRWYRILGNHLSGEDHSKKFEVSDVKTPAISELSAFENSGNIENLEDAFGKSEGGTSKKRYLVNDMINDTFDEIDVPYHRNRQLLSEETFRTTASPPTMITLKQPTTSSDRGSLDIESFIALNDDYTPEDVVSLLLKEEGQGSGFGNFVVSLFSKSLKEENETR